MPKKKLCKMYSKRNVSKCAQKKEISNVPQMDAFKVKTKKNFQSVFKKTLQNVLGKNLPKSAQFFFQILSKINLSIVLKKTSKLASKEQFFCCTMKKKGSKCFQNNFQKIPKKNFPNCPPNKTLQNVPKKIFQNVFKMKHFEISLNETFRILLFLPAETYFQNNQNCMLFACMHRADIGFSRGGVSKSLSTFNFFSSPN